MTTRVSPTGMPHPTTRRTGPPSARASITAPCSNAAASSVVTVGATLVSLCARLAHDLDHSCAVDAGIDVFAQELNDLHLGARSAARTMQARHTEVECPNDREAGICGARIRVGGLELDDVVHCPGCHRRWELHRLLLVVDSDRDAGAWLPVEDVALLYGVSRPTLNRWAKEGRVQRNHGLFELQSVRDAIAKGTGKGASA